MRRASLVLLSFALATTPAGANRCYGIDGRIYCDAGCRVVDVWWQGATQWFRWTCAPPADLVLAVAGLAVLIVVAIIGAITSRSSATTTALTTATQEADARAAEAQRITERMRAAAAEADQFLKTYK